MIDLDTLVTRARHHVEANQAYHAEMLYRQVLRQTEKLSRPIERIARGEACAFLARKALYNKFVGEAGDWFRKAIDCDPACGEYYSNLAHKVLLPLGMNNAARQHARRGTQVEPDNFRTWMVLGIAEYEAENVEASREAFLRAIELEPENGYLRLELAKLELDSANHDVVRSMIPDLLAKFPERTGDILHFEGMLAHHEGRHQDAIDILSHAMEAEGCSEPSSVRYNLALSHHAIGNYTQGWADYEARGENAWYMAMPFKRFHKPLWRGEPAPARLHLHDEMGHGDTLVMLRYAPLLVERGYEVCVEIKGDMVDLVRHSMPQVEVMAKAVDYPGAFGVRDFDYHLPMLSLPHVLNTTVETIPWQGAYLKADPDKVKTYDARLRAESGQRSRRIGLCWSSGIREGLWLREYGMRKSVKFEQLRSLWGDRDIQWVSLQVGPERKDNNGAVLDVLPKLPSWDDTAALVETLDLVITVDTALAHLVGAMGKPCWVMMHRGGSFHFMADVEGAPWQHASPWYPNTKLYRQQRVHHWDDVIARIAGDLDHV